MSATIKEPLHRATSDPTPVPTGEADQREAAGRSPEQAAQAALAKVRGKSEFAALPAEYFQSDAPASAETSAAKDAKAGLKFGRRDFMKWSTGALALAATACDRKPTQEIIPYAQQPPEITPGVPIPFASTCRECSAACGIVLNTYEGRPTKAEGNPLHPINQGTLCAIGQASLHNLYDPDRLRNPVQLERVHSLNGLVRTTPQPSYHLWVPTDVWNEGWTLRDGDYQIKRQTKALSWADADKQVSGILQRAGNRAVLLTGTIHGPARTALLADFLGVLPLRHVVYDSLNPDAFVAAQRAAYGASKSGAQTLPRYFYDRAEMVVTFGADPIADGSGRLSNGLGFGRQRKIRGEQGNYRMSRVVCFEPAMSLTGLSADSRYLVPPSQLLPLALGLAHQLVLVDKRSKFASDATVGRALAAFAPDAAERAAGVPSGALAALSAELWQQRGKSIISAGGHAGATDDQVKLELVVAFLNSALENEGATLDATGSPSLQSQGSDAAMLQLIADMNAGKVDTLFVSGANPAYTMPAAAGFIEALARVPNVIVLSDRLDETAQLANYVLPLAHGMESWGDAEPQVGLLSMVQPTIDPLFGARSFEDVLINLAYQTTAGAVRFKALAPPPAPVPPPAPTAPTVPGAATASGAAPGVAATAAKTAVPAQSGTKPGAKPAAIAAAAAAAPPAPKPAAPSGPMAFYDYLRAYWQTQIYPKNNLAASFDDFWTSLLQAGVFDPNPARLEPGPARVFNTSALAALAPTVAPASGPDELELAIVVQPIIGDGWWANNGILQEIPDPITKGCWDNYFTVSPATARRFGLTPADDHRYCIAEVTVGGRTLRAPVFAQVGVHPGVVTIALGYGRASAGQIGTDVGANAYSIVQVAAGGSALVYAGAKVKLDKLSEPTYLIATPQEENYFDFSSDHITPEIGRGERIVRQADLVQLQLNPRAGNPVQEPPLSLWDNGGPTEHPFPNYRWGMTIDQNACIGCNACVAACYAENNVSVVGKDQVWRGRQMAWIRIERYFSGDDESNPDVTLQPMNCQQCANAGCESVCPVIATITDGEGINVQVYNRCVGTRYCSNNCIYKVRRFNFFYYGKVRAAPLELALNPMVTVRSKGVMEKCNFCLQRIHAGHYRAKERGLPVRDGDIVTACQQTCPTHAIHFGNVDDPNSEMMRARGTRGYKVLEDMNFEPATQYLTRIRNRPTAVKS